MSETWLSKRARLYLIAIAVVQLLTWSLIVLLLWRMRREEWPVSERRVVAMMLVLLFGNLLYSFTPAAVGLVHFLVFLQAAVMLIEGSRRQLS